MKVPFTSSEARTKHESKGRPASNRELCLELVKAHPGLTAVELHAKQTQMRRHEVSRRLPEVEREGSIKRGDTRTCSIDGNSMLT